MRSRLRPREALIWRAILALGIGGYLVACALALAAHAYEGALR